MENEKYCDVETILQSNITIVERGKIDTHNTQIHDPHFVLYLSSRLMVVAVILFELLLKLTFFICTNTIEFSKVE
jgi:hypothetical protein